MNTNQLSWALLPSRALSHTTVPSRSLKKPNSALLKARVVVLLSAFDTFFQDPKPQHFMVTTKAAFNLHICNKSSLICEYKVQQTTLDRKLLLMHSRDSWIACALLLSCSVRLHYNSDAIPNSCHGQIQTYTRSRCCFTI